MPPSGRGANRVTTTRLDHPLAASSAGRDARALGPAPSVACPTCDLVFDLSHLQDGQTARCARCGEFLSECKADGFTRVAAYSAAALVMQVLACVFPFMHFARDGLESTMSLPETVVQLWAYGRPDMALLVAAFILAIPTLVLVLHLVLARELLGGRPSTLAAPIARLIFSLQTWSMVEVFLVGVVVSLVKIAKLATVTMGPAFWAYAAFAVLFVLAVTNLDRLQCWQRIEELGQP